MELIPSYQYFMEACLEVLLEKGQCSKKEIVNDVVIKTNITPEQSDVMLESGKSTIVNGRIGWALSYLKQAEAISSPKRAQYLITERGKGLLAGSARPINSRLLEQFPEFVEFKSRSSTPSVIEQELVNDDSSLSPEEQLVSAVKSIRESVISELLDRLKLVDPSQFERIVVDVLKAMGYGFGSDDSARVVGKSGDGGIDGIIDEDVLGLDSIYIQAKRWEGQVGRPEVQGFAGALQGFNASKGVMITTSTFSKPANEYVNNLSTSKIKLINGLKLASLMYDHGVGVSAAERIVTRTFDSDYFLTDE